MYIYCGCCYCCCCCYSDVFFELFSTRSNDNMNDPGTPRIHVFRPHLYLLYYIYSYFYFIYYYYYLKLFRSLYFVRNLPR